MINNSNTKILFIGGHYNSAIATIDWLLENTFLKNKNIVWAGHKFWDKKSTIKDFLNLPNANAKKHSEYIAISEREIEFNAILAGKIFRFKSLKYLPSFILNLILIPIGFVNAIIILIKVKPSLIVSFGGFSAVPLVIIGKLLRIKSITHEQTVVVGLANKVIEKFVEKVYTAWPVEYYSSKNISKYEFVGLPMNPYLLDKKLEYSNFNFSNNKKTILFTGGKAGAVLFNKFLLSNILELSETFNVIATIGRDTESLQKLKEIVETKKINNVKLYEYLFQKQMAEALKASDMVITRAGAHTIYELCYLNKKSLIIPLQYTSMGEQNRNASIASKNIPCIVINKDEPSDLDIMNGILDLDKLVLNLTFDSKINFVDNASEQLSNHILKLLD